MRRALAVAVVLAAVPVSAAQAADYTIRASSSGAVSAIGPFKTATDASPKAAQSVFGTPTSAGKTETVCKLGWRAIGLRVLFANFGGGDSCEYGKAQTASAFGKQWRTTRGLKVGASTKTVRKLYPRALRRGRTYRLIGASSAVGGPRRYSVLAARTRGGKVTAFTLFLGAAGE